MNDHDGHNVVLHEFAHQVDDMSGHLNGVPLLGPDQSFAEWERVFMSAFETHVREVERGHERPRALKEEAPGVYEQLSRLFRLDPVTWS